MNRDDGVDCLDAMKLTLAVNCHDRIPMVQIRLPGDKSARRRRCQMSRQVMFYASDCEKQI